jgi:hypothetical protein
MAETKKKSPDSSVDFQHGAIGDPDDYKPTYGDPKVTAANDVALQKEPRFGAKQGILESQKEVGGQSYPGRATPPVQQVTTAKAEEGAALRSSKKQTGLNRYPINPHEEKVRHHGPNN